MRVQLKSPTQPNVMADEKTEKKWEIFAESWMNRVPLIIDVMPWFHDGEKLCLRNADAGCTWTILYSLYSE